MQPNRKEEHTLRGAGYQRVSKTFAGALGRPTMLPEAMPADLGTAATITSSCCACASASAYLRARSRSSGGGFHPGPSSQYQNTPPLCGPSGSQGHLSLCPFTPMQLLGGLARKLPNQCGPDGTCRLITHHHHKGLCSSSGKHTWSRWQSETEAQVVPHEHIHSLLRLSSVSIPQDRYPCRYAKAQSQCVKLIVWLLPRAKAMTFKCVHMQCCVYIRARVRTVADGV